MNGYRRLYNRMLELKFVMLDIFSDTEGREAMHESFDLINEQLKDLDELATGKNLEPQNYVEFITGNLKRRGKQ